MNAEQVIRRVAEQSFLHCWTEEVKDEKGNVIQKPQRITRAILKEAVEEIFSVLEEAPPITNCNTIGYISFKKKLEKVFGES